MASFLFKINYEKQGGGLCFPTSLGGRGLLLLAPLPGPFFAQGRSLLPPSPLPVFAIGCVCFWGVDLLVIVVPPICVDCRPFRLGCFSVPLHRPFSVICVSPSEAPYLLVSGFSASWFPLFVGSSLVTVFTLVSYIC